MTPGWVSFDHKDILRTNMIENNHMMLHTKYQGPRPSGFRQEHFHGFPYILVSTNVFTCKQLVTPGAGAVLTLGTSFQQT